MDPFDRWVERMRRLGAGLGISVGAALGILFGLLIFHAWWAPVAGVAIGLVIGAIVDLQTSDRP